MTTARRATRGNEVVRIGAAASPRPLLDLRLIHYFVAVAEHRHFGRAATSLHLAQPSLSRQIQRLEQDVGVRLLDRTSQGVELTSAGAAFLPYAVELLGSAERATAAALRAHGPARIVVGFASGLIVTEATRELRRQHPEIDIRSRHLAWDEVASTLLDHEVDLVVTRLPFPVDGLDVTLLYKDRRVVVVPLDHRLAGRESVTLDDIADDPLIGWSDGDMDAFWRVDPRPDGSRAPTGPEADDCADKLEIVANAEALALAPAGDQHIAAHPAVTTVPVEDVEPVHVVLARRAVETNPLIDDAWNCLTAHLSARSDEPAAPGVTSLSERRTQWPAIVGATARATPRPRRPTA